MLVEKVMMNAASTPSQRSLLDLCLIYSALPHHLRPRSPTHFLSAVSTRVDLSWSYSSPSLLPSFALHPPVPEDQKLESQGH